VSDACADTASVVAGVYVATRGEIRYVVGGVLSTVTVTGADVTVTAFASVIDTASVCVPAVTAVVTQAKETDVLVTVALSVLATPSTRSFAVKGVVPPVGVADTVTVFVA
jgi:hypothetical protein